MTLITSRASCDAKNNFRLIVREMGEPYSILPTSWTRGLELGANSDQNLLSSDFWAWRWPAQAITRRAPVCGQPVNIWLAFRFCPQPPVNISNEFFVCFDPIIKNFYHLRSQHIFGEKKCKYLSNTKEPWRRWPSQLGKMQCWKTYVGAHSKSKWITKVWTKLK